MPINHFRHAIGAGTLQSGGWSGLSGKVTVQVLANTGFDWLLLDTGHSPNELPMVPAQLQAITRGATHLIVRPALCRRAHPRRAWRAHVQAHLRVGRAHRTAPEGPEAGAVARSN